MTAYSSTAVGGSVYFNGSTDYINSAGSSTVIGTGDFTIEFWAYVNAAVSSAAVFVDMRASSSATAPLIYMYTSNVLYYAVGATNQITGPTLVFNQWYHIAVSRASGSTKMFVNGVQVGSTYSDSNNYATQASRPLIGSFGDTVANRFNGYISNLRVVNQALYTTTFTPPTVPPTSTTNTSLLLLGTDTGIQDQTGKNNLVTYGLSQVQSNTVKFGSGALAFSNPSNGSYVYPATGSPLLNFGTGDFTIEAWLYPTSFSTTNGPMFIDFRPNGTNGSSYFCMGISTSGVLAYSVPNNSAYITAGSALSLNTWTHVALCRSSGVTKMFLNGVQTGSSYTDTNNYSAGANRPIIGANGYEAPSSGVDSFIGYMDDIRITKFARYTANFTPPTLAFLGQ